MVAPFWIKLAASELVRQKLVVDARLHSSYLAVSYKSGLTDKYYFSGKPPSSRLSFKVEEDQMKIGCAIPIERTYETDLLDKSEQIGCAHHLHIDKKHLQAGSLLDARLALHRFIAILSRSKPELDQYPVRDVRRWIGILRKFNYSRMITADAFNFYRQISLRVPWRQVLWQFFPPRLNYKPKEMMIILMNAVGGVPAVNTTTLNRILLRRAAGHILNPLTYCAILERLGGRAGVIDLHPERGYKAIACGLLGLPYFYRQCEEIQVARDREIKEILGLNCEPLTGQKADLLLSDAHFEQFDIDQADSYLGRVHTMVAYVPRADRLRLMAKYKPTQVVKVLCRYRQGRQFKETAEQPDFLFLW